MSGSTPAAMLARRQRPMRRLAMSTVLCLLLPTFATGQNRAPVAADISERHRDLFQYALAALPDEIAPHSMRDLRSTVARAFYAMDQGLHNGFFALDVRTLTSMLRSPSAPFEVRRLVGDWDCRRILVGPDGLSVSDHFSCTIRKNERCLELVGLATPDRPSGCLNVLDNRHMASSTGVLSAANILNLRMIEPHADGIAVYDFLRNHRSPHRSDARSMCRWNFNQRREARTALDAPVIVFSRDDVDFIVTGNR